MSASLWRPEPGSPRRSPRLPRPTLPLPAGPVAAPQDLCPAPSSVRLPRPQHAGVLSCQDSEKGLGPFTGPGLLGPSLPSAHEARGPSRRDSLSLSLPLRSFHWLQAIRQVKVRPVSPSWVAPRAPVDTPAWPRAPPLWPAPCGAPQAVSDAAAHTWQTHADTHTHTDHTPWSPSPALRGAFLALQVPWSLSGVGRPVFVTDVDSVVAEPDGPAPRLPGPDSPCWGKNVHLVINK